MKFKSVLKMSINSLYRLIIYILGTFHRLIVNKKTNILLTFEKVMLTIKNI